ncbi:MAG: glycoside hydrolase family 5 protein [Deltaproteobacteria bacterium]|nr:glycoside hydrolase family 5 protein [Deltaproteobacteria bacterium]
MRFAKPLRRLVFLWALSLTACAGDAAMETEPRTFETRAADLAREQFRAALLDPAGPVDADLAAFAAAPPPEAEPLLDEDGRQIVLHGANYMGMEFGWFGHAPEDFERMVSWGFNVVRLPIAWRYLEPDEGVYDADYLIDHVEPTIDAASAAGLRVILDMHQWKWSPCCGGNGAPEWTCDDPTGGDYDWLRQATLFWDHPEYLDHFVDAWEMVAEYFADDDRIWGYDLWNEPQGGLRTIPWTFDNGLLRPLYVRFIEAIRAHHAEPFILFEPNIIHVVGIPFVMDPLPYDRLIYAPHNYPLNTGDGGDYLVSKVGIRRQIERLARDAADHGVPYLLGETGVTSGSSRAEDFSARQHRGVRRAHDEFHVVGLLARQLELRAARWGGRRKRALSELFIPPLPDGHGGAVTRLRVRPGVALFRRDFSQCAGA